MSIDKNKKEPTNLAEFYINAMTISKELEKFKEEAIDVKDYKGVPIEFLKKVGHISIKAEDGGKEEYLEEQGNIYE